MIKKIIIEKIIIYVLILLVGVAVVYATRMREQGYTDKNGNYVRGTTELADEFMQNYINEVIAMGFEYSETGDSYLTFKKDAQISSVIKVKADFTHEGIEVLDYIGDIYFEDSTDLVNIQEVMSKAVPGVNLGAEFSVGTALEEYNNTGVTLTRESNDAILSLKPIDGFGGVVVGIKKK